MPSLELRLDLGSFCRHRQAGLGCLADLNFKDWFLNPEIYRLVCFIHVALERCVGLQVRVTFCRRRCSQHEIKYIKQT